MADATYSGQSPNYRKQGGAETVISSTLTVEGTMTVSGTQRVTGTLSSTAGTVVIEHSTAGYVADSVQNFASSTAGTLTPFGVTIMGTTQACAFTLPAGVPGQRKILINTLNGATTVTKVITTASTAITIAGTSDGMPVTLRTLTFTDGGESAELIALTSTAWGILSKTAQVVLTS